MSFRPKGFFCFSPAVMIATFAIEIILFAYVIMRYKMTTITRLGAALLFCLAFFQLAEYQVCGATSIQAMNWSRLGYVSITMLPALGLHLSHAIAGRPFNRVTAFGYGAAGLWSGLFLFGEQVFRGYECTGNYAIFQLRDNIGGWYSLYYYGIIFLTIFVAYRLSQRTKVRVKQALASLVVGYAVFLIPTATVNAVAPETTAGIPSIMCGFAVLFAILLVARVLPLSAKQTKTAKPARVRSR